MPPNLNTILPLLAHLALSFLAIAWGKGFDASVVPLGRKGAEGSGIGGAEDGDWDDFDDAISAGRRSGWFSIFGLCDLLVACVDKATYGQTQLTTPLNSGIFNRIVQNMSDIIRYKPGPRLSAAGSSLFALGRVREAAH